MPRWRSQRSPPSGRAPGATAGFIDAAIAGGAAYIAFMIAVDVPMYLSRWQAELAQGMRYLSPGEGLREVLQRCSVTRDWLAWRQDALWLSLYFTYAVWISIALAHAPPLARAGESLRHRVFTGKSPDCQRPVNNS